jgi:peptide/nickel transport system permease protein
MDKYIIRRILAIIPTIIIISIIGFFLLNMAPGDPATAMIPSDASSFDIEAIRERFGLNAPLYVRYWSWLKEILKGNLGYSYTTGRPVIELISYRIPASLELMGAALLISTLLGISLGLISGLKRYTLFDHIFTFFGLVWLSIPQFFLGLVGIYIFAIKLKLLPLGGRTAIGENLGFWSRVFPLILPAFVLGLVLTAALMRYTRSSIIDVINKDYIATAFSKGEPLWYVYIVHGFRNAAIPVMIILVYRFATLLGSTVFIENVFSWPGLGTLLITAVNNRDYPLVLGILLIISVVVLIVSLLIDILTALLDPRVRYE